MAAAFPLTVSTTGRLLFLSCFRNSPERRRKVVSDWMSFVMSSIGPLPLKHLFRCYQNAERRGHSRSPGPRLSGSRGCATRGTDLSGLPADKSGLKPSKSRGAGSSCQLQRAEIDELEGGLSVTLD